MNPTMTAEAGSDAELVIAARRQEPGAYGELFRRWYDRCYDVALNIVRDSETAADIAQDTFLVGWERLMDLRDPEAFGGWILRTARNRAINRVTRDRHRTMERIEPNDQGTVLPDPDADPALHAERSDQRRLIWTAVSALGERDTSLLDLHLRHGLEPAEIAEELQITPNNASQLLFRLRRKLREAIGAVLLWRDGHPTCTHLAALLAETGSFGPKVAVTIRRHQRDCDQCLGEISRQTNPERLFAAVPFAVAPLLFKERAAAALAQAGIPMAPPAVGAAVTPVTPGPPQGAGRAFAAAAIAVAGALVVVTAVLWWPSGPDRPPVSSGRPPVTATASVAPTSSPAALSTSVGPADAISAPAPSDVPVLPVAPTARPTVSRSHAALKPVPARTTATARPSPTTGPTGIPAPPGPVSPPGPVPPPWPGPWPGNGGGHGPGHHCPPHPEPWMWWCWNPCPWEEPPWPCCPHP
ncbi:MAG TPA: sigma-70 family RNA polymerase sigma factor [Kineosporiaceae bacterium]|nr:sigma-70 family RNA polymerase sigma factor [Kineosporiaceae bacterium]